MLRDRLLIELAQLDEYSKEKSEFIGYFITDDNPLTINVKLLIKEHEYEFICIYPIFFPTQPIIIKKITDFKTSHCYLNGSMCLKWGSDNWNKNITLKILLDNLIELLELENPLGNEHQYSKSGDNMSFGQLLYYKEDNFIIVPYDIMNCCGERGKMILNKKVCKSGKTVYYISKIDNNEISTINDLIENEEIFYIKTQLLKDELMKMDISYVMDFFKVNSNSKVLLLTADPCPIIINNSENPYYLDFIVHDYEVNKRSGLHQEVLNKKITIIGLGSVGSRVFLDLARAGFNNFYIIDNDVMLPYNTLRHELTDTNVGEYKVYELKNKVINEINKNANIVTSTLNMVGQESTIATDQFLRNCASSDLIIDCTANDNLLMLLNDLSLDNNIPIISGTVIPGGLGNVILIKKSEDCSIESVLQSYYEWTSKNSIFAKQDADYSATIENQRFVATMSDCSIAAGLIGKTAIKLLIGDTSDLSNINILSTSQFGDLEYFYHAYKINAHQINFSNEKYDPILIEKGKKIYENYSKKRSGR